MNKVFVAKSSINKKITTGHVKCEYLLDEISVSDLHACGGGGGGGFLPVPTFLSVIQVIVI